MIVQDKPDEAVYDTLLNAVLDIRPADCPAVDRKARPFSVLDHDEDGRLAGGAYGFAHPGWAYIDLLWVREDRRRRGLGRRLMAEAEKAARDRGCHSVYLWTQDYEAPDLYRKLGYKEFVTLEDFIPGHRRIGFMKRIAT